MISRRGTFSVVGILLLSWSATAAEPPGTGLAIKLHNGLEYLGAVVKDDGETVVLTTTVGERAIRRTDIVSSRKILTEAETKVIADAVVVAKTRSTGVANARDTEPPIIWRGADAEASRDRAAVRVVTERHLDPYERMDRQLDKKITVEFVDTPLEDTLSFLSSLTGLNIIINPKVREAKPLVTLRVADMDAGTAIRWITRLTETHAEIKDQAIYITDKPSEESSADERQEILNLAAQMHATVDLPPDGTPLTDSDRAKIAMQLWEKEQPKIVDFPGPDMTLGGMQAGNPFGSGTTGP